MFKFLVKFGKIMMIACLIGVAFRVIEVTTKKDYNIAQINQNETIAEEVNINDAETEIEDISVSNNIEEKQIENVKEKDEQKQLNSKVVDNTNMIKKQEKETKPKVDSVVEKQEKIEIKEEKSEEQIVETKKGELIVKKEESKQEEIKEEYKINNQMIEKIKNIIKNNETEDMKEYGYDIVIDSSIPDITNEFTFSEQRVINKLTWKFGTIRIYVRDYYNNGTYISTQCFII